MAEERKLLGAEIRTALADKIVEGKDAGGRGYTQIFQAGGLTIYTVKPSSISTGLWDVHGDQFCSQWPPNTTWSCYDVLGDSKHLTFVAADGAKWPVMVLQ